MPKNRNFDTGDVFVASWTDAIQEFISSVSANLRVTLANATTVRILGGSGSAQVGVGVDGQWRYITSNVDVAHPGGSTGVYDIFLVISANSFSAPDTDATDYSFGVRVLASGNTPTGNHNGRAISAYRKVGEVDWDGTGSRITSVRQTVGLTDSTGPVSPTAPVSGVPPFVIRNASGRPTFLVSDAGGIEFLNGSGVSDTFLTRAGAGSLSTGAFTVSDRLTIGDDAVLSRPAGEAVALLVNADLQIQNALAHLGSRVGFYGVTPVSRPARRTLTSWDVRTNSLRTIDRNAFSLEDLFDFVATLVYDLQQQGLIS